MGPSFFRGLLMLILRWIRHRDLDRLNEAFLAAQLRSPKVYDYKAPFWNGREYVITWYEPVDAEYFTGDLIREELNGSEDNT